MKTKNNQKPKAQDDQKRDLSIRAASLECRAAEGDKPAQVHMSVSSETQVLTFSYFNNQYQRVYEILDHAETSIDMSRCSDGLVILDRHYGDQIGLMKCDLTDRKLGGLVDFCTGERAQEIAQDAAKGLRRNVSVGYRVDADSYRLEGQKDGIPVVRAMSWMPYEASFEPVPADTSVGVGRSAQNNAGETSAQIEEKKMDPKEMAKLFARAAEHGIETAKVEALIADGKGRAELDALIVDKQRGELAELKTRKPDATTPASVPAIGGEAPAIVKKERRYSLANMFRHAMGITQDEHGNKVDAGLEIELSQECKRYGGTRRGGQFMIPHAALAKREFTVSGTSSSSVGTNLLAGEFIDLLRTRSVLGLAGVRFLTGLTGNIAIPKMSAGATGYWVAESGAITGSQPTLGQVTGTPHTCGVLTDISRRMLLQSTPDAESMIREELVQRIIRTVQIAVFAGTGADGQPSAITNASGINNPTVTAGTPTYDQILNFPGSIEADNAAQDGQMWIMTAEVWAKLAATFTNATYGEKPLANWEAGTMLARKYLLTEDVPANSLWFGAWNTVNIGVWGNGIDINMDTSTLSSEGGLRVVALQDVDVMVRLGQALAYNTAVTS